MISAIFAHVQGAMSCHALCHVICCLCNLSSVAMVRVDITWIET